jgi:hypothetical protein
MGETESPHQDTTAAAVLPGTVIVAADVIWQLVDEQVVVLELNAGRYYTLDPVGSRIWEALVECADVAAALQRLLDQFDVDETTLRRDLVRLIDEMVSSGLVSTQP